MVVCVYLIFTFRECTHGGVCVPCIYLQEMYSWWSLCTLYLLEGNVLMVVFVCLVFTCCNVEDGDAE